MKRQRGQAVVLLAVLIGTLCLVLALAIDTGLDFVESAAAQRAASAAALSGVVYMPYQFDRGHAFPPSSTNDAVDRAVLEARRNGFDVNDTADGVSVTVSAVPGFSNRLQVTVTKKAPFGFGGFLRNGAYVVSRSAVAEYLQPISLGQPGNELGSTVSQLGGTGFYFLRTEGWATDRQQGDAFTPDPGFEYGGVLSPPSTDVHRISTAAGTDPADATLPTRGGENFRVSLPAGGSIQVYNAAFAPETVPNFCENARPGSPGYKCSPGSAYYMHETDSFGALAPASKFSAMRYTVYSVANLFIRADDTKLTQMTVFPIAVTGPGVYQDVNTGAVLTQTYDATGNPTDMSIYHAWINVASYQEPAAPGLVTYDAAGPRGGILPAGTYRLRVDTLEANGAIPNNAGSSIAHKGYAVRVLDATGQPCAQCTVGAWDDMTVYTPVTGGTFAVPLFNVPPEYAGKTISVDIYDPGDISSAGGFVNLALLDPSGAVAAATPPQSIAVHDLGVQRTNPQSAVPCVLGSPDVNAPCFVQSTGSAAMPATVGGATYYNGHWLDIQLPIPADYNPGADPNGWWWSLRYNTPAGTTANDTLTVAVGFGGAPSHLIN